jgi:hypothetical protein
MPTKKMFPMSLFAEITRADEETRTVEGYAYVNETVPGEGGLRLKRSAMEAATPGFMQWGNLREMHQPSAVGNVEEHKWDETGFYIRGKIVDDVAWKKVIERVYKGFSVGVNPKLIRGKDVEAVDFIEISLVDRPKDADCPIKFIRTAEHAEVDCEVIDDKEEAPVETPKSSAGGGTGEDDPKPTERVETPTYKRGTFAEYQKTYEQDSRRSMAFNWLSSCLWDIANADIDGNTKEQLARQSIAEFSDYVAPLLRASGMVPPELCRAALCVDAFAEAHKATELRAELSRAQVQINSLQVLVDKAKLTPASDQPTPVKTANGVDRNFLNRIANGDEGEGKANALKEEYASIETALQNETDEDKKQAGVRRMLVITSELQSYGYKA